MCSRTARTLRVRFHLILPERRRLALPLPADLLHQARQPLNLRSQPGDLHITLNKRSVTLRQHRLKLADPLITPVDHPTSQHQFARRVVDPLHTR